MFVLTRFGGVCYFGLEKSSILLSMLELPGSRRRAGRGAAENFPMIYFLAIASGFVLTNLGFWMNNEKAAPSATWGLWVMMLGLGLTFGGILLSCVPGFFSS